MSRESNRGRVHTCIQVGTCAVGANNGVSEKEGPKNIRGKESDGQKEKRMKERCRGLREGPGKREEARDGSKEEREKGGQREKEIEWQDGRGGGGGKVEASWRRKGVQRGIFRGREW